MYAIKTLFSYGWDYVGSMDGKRLLYNTREEAQADLETDMKGLLHLGHNMADWCIVEYVESQDSKDDL